MTVEQALARARELRPGCKISDETCRRWLCEEDALLRQQLFEKSGADEYAAAGADLAWSGERCPTTQCCWYRCPLMRCIRTFCAPALMRLWARPTAMPGSRLSAAAC